MLLKRKQHRNTCLFQYFKRLREVCHEDKATIRWVLYLLDVLPSGTACYGINRLGSTPLHAMLSTCYGGQDERLRAFLINVMLRGADGAPAPEVHMRDRRGEIPLHVACKAGLVTCVEVLLCHKSNIDALNNAGRSVIFEAKQLRRSKVLTQIKTASRPLE